MGGVAAQRRAHNGDGRVILGAFVDAGDGSYSTYNPVAVLDNSYRGRGELDYVGGGILLHREWKNGFRLDTMIRGGSVQDEFWSYELAELIGTDSFRYKKRNGYLGTDMGLNYTQRLNKRCAFDVYSRYSFVTVGGGKVELPTGEVLDFKSINSHRLISGGRWTAKYSSKLSAYIGAAYEHEFDGRARAVEQDLGLVLDGSTLRGGTSVGEVGLTMRPSNRFQLTTGLEGYTGKRDGGSAFASAVWRW